MNTEIINELCRVISSDGLFDEFRNVVDKYKEFLKNNGIGVYYACTHCSSIEKLRYLISNGAKIDSDSLFYACLFKNPKQVECLLDIGFNSNERRKFEGRDTTPINEIFNYFQGCMNNYDSELKILELLLEYNGKPNDKEIKLICDNLGNDGEKIINEKLKKSNKRVRVRHDGCSGDNLECYSF